MDASTLEQLTEAEAKLKLRVVEIQTEAINLLATPLREAWDTDDDNSNLRTRPKNPLARSRGNNWTAVRDNAEGRFWPFYETEEDIRRNLAACRNLKSFDSTAIGATQAQRAYVCGGEWKIDVKIDGKTPKEDKNAARLQGWIDKTLDRWDWYSSTLDDWYEGCVEDGELFAVLYPELNGEVGLDRYYPEQCREPAGRQSLNAWLGEPDSCQWHFGVHTALCHYANKPDWARPLGYHFVEDDAGMDWEYFPAWPNPDVMDDARCCFHWKWNATARAARGVSDFYPILEDLERVYKLARNTGEGAAIQAAIAMVIQRDSKNRVATMNDVMGNAIDQVIRTRSTGGAMTTYKRRFEPGTVVETDKESTYNPGPLGASDANNYIEVGAYLTRSRIGVRWNMPEYLISGDASNSAYASTLTAESPFVKFCEHRQKRVKQLKEHVLWRALRMAHMKSKFTPIANKWEEFESRVDLDIVAPDVATRDPLIQTQRYEILRRNGIVTQRRWAQQEGLPEEDVEAPPTPMATTPNDDAATVAAMASATPNVANTSPATPNVAPVAESIRREWETLWLGYP